MTGSNSKKPSPATVLIIEDAVLVQLAIAARLRDCDYRAILALTYR